LGGGPSNTDADREARRQAAAATLPTPGLVDHGADVAIGAAKGLGHTVTGMGNLARKVPGVAALDRVVAPVEFNTTPTNTAQQVGFTGEQLGEFFLPTGVAGKGALAADVAKSAGLTLAQGGSPTAAAVSGVLTAALPAIGSAKRLSQRFQKGAEKRVVQALGATKESAKAESAKLAPEMLRRGVRGSRESMLSQASARVERVGAQLDDAYRAAAQQGGRVSGDIVRGNIQLAADELMTIAADGSKIPIKGTERVIKRLSSLDEFVSRLDPDIPVDQAAAIKKTWDRIVSRAGLYGQKAGASATDAADAWAVREGASAFRNLLNTNPDIAALNKEFAFWKGLKNVLKSTELRTQAQGAGLAAAVGATAGAASGFASGDDMTGSLTKGAIGGLAFRKLTTTMQSPWFRTMVSARLKSQLAQALASGSATHVEQVSKRILMGLPAQVGRDD